MPLPALSTTEKTPAIALNELLFGSLWLNPYFFARGLVVLHQDAVSTDTTALDLHGRDLQFASETNKKALKKNQVLLQQLFATKLSSININASADFIINRARRDEQFFPVALSDEAGTYVYPWGQKLPKNFQGFNHFVTAGCMFGGNLQGVLSSGVHCALINHDLVLPQDESIVAIIERAEANPFELALFAEFAKNCQLIMRLNHSNDVPKVSYHLPYQDYILFGMKLCAQGMLTQEVLTTFIDKVCVKAAHHHARLQELATQYGIKLTLTSPFAGLFSADFTNPDLITQQAQSFLAQSYDETVLVKSCLDKLIKHNVYGALWQKAQDIDKPKLSNFNDVEALLRVGNTLVIAAQTFMASHKPICTLYPLTEKQIQLNFASWAKKGLASAANITHLTLLDPVITYTPTTAGLLFYCACSLNRLAQSLGQDGLMRQASKNLSLFAHTSSAKTPDSLKPSSPGPYHDPSP